MKVLLVILGLIMFGACTDTEEVEQEQVKTEQVEEVKEEIEVVEEVKEEEQKDFKQVLNEKYKPKFDKLFKNSPYPMIAFEHKNDKNYVTLQADITRDEWVQGFYSQLDNRSQYCGQLASKRGGHSEKTIREWVNQCNQVVATGKFDNLEWYFIYHNMNGYTEQAELDEVFNPLQCLYTLTGDKKNLEITVVDANGDLLYKVANKDVETVFKSVKSWTSDEQLAILSHSMDFATGYYWFGYYEGWLGLE